MSCPTCTPMYATTEQRLAIRRKNMASVPDAKPIPCPSCGSTDWATSREMIKEEPVQPVWWKRFGWRELMYLHWFGVAACVFGFATSSTTTVGWWMACFNAFFMGVNLAGAWSAYRQVAVDAALDDIQKKQREITMMMQEERIMPLVAMASHLLAEDDDPPIAPRLH